MDDLHGTHASARGFPLMHILLHELGHHDVRMTTRARFEAGRGEDHAERDADRIRDEHFELFGWSLSSPEPEGDRPRGRAREFARLVAP